MLKIKTSGGWGSDIREHLEEAIKGSKREAISVCFDFNGKTVKVTPFDTVETAYARWEQEGMAAAEAYWASPAGLAEKAKRNQEILDKQAAVDASMANLDIATVPKAIAWLKVFLDTADDIAVSTDIPKLLATFAAAGYMPGWGCGKSVEFYGHHEHLGRWLIGQVMDMWAAKGYVNTNLTGKFINKYEKLLGG